MIETENKSVDGVDVIQFYSLSKLTEKNKSVIFELTEKNDLTNLRTYINNITDDNVLFGQLENDLGLSFMFFNNTFKYYEPTKESINDFLCREDRILMDSDSNILTADDIWKLVDENKDKSDYETETKEFIFDEFELEDLCIDEQMSYSGKDWLLKYNPKFYEFYNDGLRFSSDDKVTRRK